MRILPFCAVVALVVGVTGVSSRAQTVPQGGTLVIQVPRGFLPSDDYWVYVNGKMVSAPPHAAFPTLKRDFMQVIGGSDAAPRDEYWDADGRAAFSEGGHFTFQRAGVRERVFEDLPLAQKAPGKYVVELMTRAAMKPFPFALQRIEAQLASGGTQHVELGIPAGTDETWSAQASRCSACFISIHPPAETLEFIHADLNRTVDAFDKSAIVPVLDETMLNLSVTPGRKPTVSAALPLSMGGGRELDARQIELILTALENNYGFGTIKNKALLNAEPPTPQLAAALSLRISEHNARIASFQKIITALEHAKR
jgi:hypothetical protein